MNDRASSDSALRARATDGREYVVRVLPLKTPGPEGQGSKAVVLSRRTDDEDWRPVSMNLRWRSRIAQFLFTTWPPETVDSIACHDETVVLRYRDHWSPFTKGSEYEWEATFDARGGKWTLHKVRRLDYDGADVPPTTP